MSATTMQDLRDRLGRVKDVRSAISLLEWDQETYMPKKAAEGRGRQLATLSALAHRLFADEETGRLIDRVRENGVDGDDAKLVDAAAYDYERARKLPETFVETFAEARSTAYEVWVDARKKKDFVQFEPQLARTVELLRQRAEYLGYEQTPYDALLEDHERGMTAAQLDTIFPPLAEAQSKLIERIMSAPERREFPWLEQNFDERIQWDITIQVLRDMGYDLDAGRQDRSVHPFSLELDIYDVRVTTRIAANELFAGLTGSTHEGGHALYEQGFLPSDRRTPLAQAPSLGMHESQSRLWENIIGRSLPFWRHYGPMVIERYGTQLAGVTPEDLYRAINIVEPTFIRVEADECTYNLHIILRYEIEKALIENAIAPRDVPALWNEKFKAYLGIDVPDDGLGCLQDIHWSHGLIGYFPTYALGNLYASQLFEQVEKDEPGLWQGVEQGNFKPLLNWLREHVHRHGRRKTAVQIVTDATGRPPDSNAYLTYLTKKYEKLYAIPN